MRMSATLKSSPAIQGPVRAARTASPTGAKFSAASVSSSPPRRARFHGNATFSSSAIAKTVHW